jgi:hemoglobin
MSTEAAKAVVRLNTGEVQGRDNFEVFEEMESMESHRIVANQDSSSTLYERVGGKSAVTAVVNLFYDRIIKDPLLLPFFDGIDVRRQKSKQVAFLSTVFGGPTRYSGEDLRQAHGHLVARGLSDQHFDAVADHLQSTLQELSVPATLVEEIMAIVESTRNDVLNR